MSSVIGFFFRKPKQKKPKKKLGPRHRTLMVHLHIMRSSHCKPGMETCLLHVFVFFLTVCIHSFTTYHLVVVKHKLLQIVNWQQMQTSCINPLMHVEGVSLEIIGW